MHTRVSTQIISSTSFFTGISCGIIPVFTMMKGAINNDLGSHNVTDAGCEENAPKYLFCSELKGTVAFSCRDEKPFRGSFKKDME